MLLSDEEIWAMTLPYSYAYIHDVSACKEFVRTIESAILEKLAAKELPEPVGAYELVVGQEEWQGLPSEIIEMRDAYSADQLHEAHAQGFAAGAAAQLAEKPLAYFYHDASCPEMANPLLHSTLLLHVDDRNSNLKNETPLYTRRQA